MFGELHRLFVFLGQLLQAWSTIKVLLTTLISWYVPDRIRLMVTLSIFAHVGKLKGFKVRKS